jgi:hypothetical protein
VYSDGTVRNVLGNASPLRDANGNPRGSVSSFIDITKRKRIEDAILHHNAVLQAINVVLEAALTSKSEKALVQPAWGLPRILPKAGSGSLARSMNTASRILPSVIPDGMPAGSRIRSGTQRVPGSGFMASTAA